MNPVWLQNFSNALSETPFSQFIQNQVFLVPLIQSVHLISVTVIVGAYLMVDIAHIELGHFERRIEESGKTRLRDRYIVSAPVAGRLARSGLREGDTVVAGQVVATIWPAPPPLRPATRPSRFPQGRQPASRQPE